MKKHERSKKRIFDLNELDMSEDIGPGISVNL